MTLRTVLCLAAIGCGSSNPPAQPPTPPTETAPPADAAVEPAPDALPDAVMNAAPWVFAYRTTDRSEKWTLRHAGGIALLVVETAQGERRYVGPATEAGAELKLDVSTGAAKLALACKHEKLAVGTKCNDRKAKPIAVLSCYHVDFKTPMPFAPSPGVEYVVDGTCNGYRLATP